MMVGTKSQYFMLSQHCTEGAWEVHGKVMVGTKSQYFMLSQHCTEGVREVCGR